MGAKDICDTGPPKLYIIMMCPSAFDNDGFYTSNGPRGLRNVKNELASEGISIDRYASSGSVLLHELTHAVLKSEYTCSPAFKVVKTCFTELVVIALDARVAGYAAYEPQWIQP
jgi:hypothetical protein